MDKKKTYTDLRLFPNHRKRRLLHLKSLPRNVELCETLKRHTEKLKHF